MIIFALALSPLFYPLFTCKNLALVDSLLTLSHELCIALAYNASNGPLLPLASFFLVMFIQVAPQYS